MTTETPANTSLPATSITIREEFEVYDNKTTRQSKWVNRSNITRPDFPVKSNYTVTSVFDYPSNSTNVTYLNSTLITYDKVDSATFNESYLSTAVQDKTKKTLTVYQGGKTTTTNVRRLLLNSFSHIQGSTSNHLLSSCFTGFGDVSVVEINKYTQKEPTFDDCMPYRNSVKPDTTLANLRVAVGN